MADAWGNSQSVLTFHRKVKIALSDDCRSTFLNFADSVKVQVDLSKSGEKIRFDTAVAYT